VLIVALAVGSMKAVPLIKKQSFENHAWDTPLPLYRGFPGNGYKHKHNWKKINLKLNSSK
jgi:hypothetical protein